MTTMILDSVEEIPELLANIQEDLEQVDFTGWLQGELALLADLHKSYFDSSTGPDGQPWSANAPSTVRQKGHAVILRGLKQQRQKNVKATKRRPAVKHSAAKGIGGFRLATSLTAKTTQSFGDAIREAVSEQAGGALTFGTDVPYAVYNDQGTNRIPARPHIGMPDKHLDAMVERVLDFTIKQLKG